MFKIEAQFAVDIFLIKVPFQSEIKINSSEIDFGDFSYDSATNQLIHNTNDKVVINNAANFSFHILSPRENITHKTVGGVPVYEDEDFQTVSLVEFKKLLLEYCQTCNLQTVHFDHMYDRY